MHKSALDEIANRSIYEGIDENLADIFDIDLSKTFSSLEESLANMQVRVRHETWFRSAKYVSLKDAAPELFNEDDSINMDALAEFVNSDMFRKLSEENQRYLQYMLDNWETYQDALSSVKDYLTDIFGDLGSTMMDALVSAFEDGTDAAQAFTDSVSDMLEQLATNMIYSVTLGPVFEKAQKEMLGIFEDEGMTDDERFKGFTAVLEGLISDALSQQELANELMGKYREMAENAGLDIYTPEEGSGNKGLSSSIQGVTEDTANLLGSYLNAIRHDVSVKRNLLENIGTNLLPTISITAQAQLQQLNAIAANTKANADAAKRIDEALSSVITTGSKGRAIKIQ